MAGFDAYHVTTSVTEEVDQLKSKYGEQCRVIKDVGEFAYVIQIKMKDYDPSIKFQVESSYPSTAPCVVVKSESLGPEMTEKLITTMNTQANIIQSGTAPIMDGLFQHAVQWVEKQDIPIQSGVIPKNTDRSSKNKKKGKSGKRHHEQVDRVEKKKSSLKTATDVISRILWDESLPTDCFAVGYLDRFVGVVEKAFTAFSWEDIASVDYNTLAVPKHRIQYFKYKNMIVWDKNKRLDWVFGSDGNGKTITDAMAEYETAQICTPIPPPQDYTAEYDDDSDDDIAINLSDNENVEVPQEPYWGAKMRPTHFLALKITNPEVREAVGHAQTLCTNLDAQYEECLIPPARLHVTLCCLGLDTTEQISDACQVLNKIQTELAKSWDPSKINLEFEGVDNFFHSCLYAKVKPNQRFVDFVHHLRICIAEAGVSIRDVFEYSPHLTLMKLSKTVSHEIRTRYLDPRFYTVLENMNFSSQSVDNIHLCVMAEVPQPNEFYRCPAVIKFEH